MSACPIIHPLSLGAAAQLSLPILFGFDVPESAHAQESSQITTLVYAWLRFVD